MKQICLTILILLSSGCFNKNKDEIDSIPPTITLNGSSEISIFIGDRYEELSAEVTDNYDSFIEIQINHNIDTESEGTYIVVYEATDSSGNYSSKERIVNVILDMPPQINLNGDSNSSIYKGGTYTELGAQVIDDKDNELIVTIEGNVNTDILGTYEIIYSTIDSYGNNATANRTIEVLASAFVTRWQTDQFGASDNNQIILLINPDYDYDYNVDWGDGTIDKNIKTMITHTYDIPGEYILKITGLFPHFTFGTNKSTTTDSNKLITILHWGDNTWLTMKDSFRKTSNLEIQATDSPDLSLVSDMSGMFENSNINHDLHNWNVSSVTNMQSLFNGADNFNQDLSGWDVSSVTNMRSMLSSQSFNQNINNWDVSSVIDMTAMFEAAYNFDQNLNSWDVSSVKNMTFMFHHAYNFNSDISNWDVSAVENMKAMFLAAKSFNQDIGNWNVSSVTNMEIMFSVAENFNQNLNNWDVSSVTSMWTMFTDAISYNQPMNLWDISSVQLLSGMFQSATSFNQDISNWDVSGVYSFENMFDDIKLSTENYDKLLISWSTQMLDTDKKFDGGNSTYTPNSMAKIARDYLTDSLSWTINDGGPAE